MRDIEEYANVNGIPIMHKEGIEFLVNYIKENDIKNILEIGTAIGYSAIKMAEIDTSIKITTIERDKERYECAVTNTKEYNQIELILGDALEIELDGKYDLIFIDAAKSQYIKFFEKYKKNLNIGGVIVSDNLAFHGLVADPSKTSSRNTKQLVSKIRKYIDFLESNEEFDTVFYSVGDGISVTKRKNE